MTAGMGAVLDRFGATSSTVYHGPPSPTGEGYATLSVHIMISDSDPSGTSALEDDSREGMFRL